MVYGGAYQRYGGGHCSHCGERHAGFMQIRESSMSRFKLLQFAAELMSRNAPVAPPHISVGAGQKYMLGLLISGPHVLVAASGNNNNRIRPIAQMKGYTLCPEINGFAGHVSRGGRAIPDGQYGATHRDNAPGNCAAPRLIEHALTMPAVRANWRNWAMSEIYYQPNTERRTQDDKYWVHGLSAHHCQTCELLVPLLMCIRP